MPDARGQWLHEMPDDPGTYIVASNHHIALGYVHRFLEDGRLGWLVPHISPQWHHYPAGGPSGWWWWSEPIHLAPVPDWHAPKNVTRKVTA